MEKISIFGAGYVGLVSAVCFADRGYEVFLVTHDPEKAVKINSGIPPFYESSLKEFLERAVKSGKLQATLNHEEALLKSEISFIAVGTPSKPDGSIDLTFIEKASVEIGQALGKKRGYHLIALRSTVIPGTTEGLVKPTLEENSGKEAGIDFGLAMQPEFLRQGSAIKDTLNPDRIVIGEYDEKSGKTLERLYRSFYKKKLPPLLRMSLAAAEMVKYASNAFLATKISYINQIANICEKIKGVDVVKVAEGMGLDPRIGKKFLRAGAGWGGSCFPKDVKALTSFSRSLNYEPSILKAALEVNERQALHVVELAKGETGSLKGKSVAVLGLAFKPGTDDVREAPSIKIIKELISQGAKVTAYDPVAMENAKKVLGGEIEYAPSAQECLRNADCCILVTEWNEFKRIKPKTFIETMRTPILIDSRRMYNPEKYSKGIKYRGIGLGR